MQMKLRSNPPEVRVKSRQKLCTEVIYIVLQTSVERQFKYLLKRSHSNNTKCQKKIRRLYETLESTGKMKLMMKFYL